MTDDTESFRREMLETGQPYVDLARADQRWDTDQLRASSGASLTT